MGDFWLRDFIICGFIRENFRIKYHFRPKIILKSYLNWRLFDKFKIVCQIIRLFLKLENFAHASFFEETKLL